MSLRVIEERIDAALAGIRPAGPLTPFIGHRQRQVLFELLRGEEGPWYANRLETIGRRIVGELPATYAQASLGDDAVAYLRYFVGNFTCWITEKDMTGPAQHQAFGLIHFQGGEPTLGYIGLPEIFQAGAELDLHFEPTTLRDIRAQINT